MVGEPSRVNGRLGGRPRGKLPPEVYAARKKARQSLVELCQRNEAKYISELEKIAFNGISEAARISAIGMLLDRGRGKVVEPHDHEHHENILVVHTGVPEPDNEVVIEPDDPLIDDGMELRQGATELMTIPAPDKNTTRFEARPSKHKWR